jgi:hypothetical protein
MYAVHLILLGALCWAVHAAIAMRNTTYVKIILLAELWKKQRDIDLLQMGHGERGCEAKRWMELAGGC